MELEAVKPDSGNEELRLKVSALPLRVRIDQDIVTFLQGFFLEETDLIASEPFTEIQAELTAQAAPGTLYS